MNFADVVVLAAISMGLGTVILFALGARLRSTHWVYSLALIFAVFSASWLLQWNVTGGKLPFTETLLIAFVLGAAITAVFEDWTSIGHAAFATVVSAAVTFLAYGGYVIASAELGPWSLAFSSVLFFWQCVTLVLLVATMFETIDVICRRTWKRPPGTKVVPEYAPKVSIHVPIHSEPPELVVETLNALAKLDYANFEVLVIDNNTSDESLWRPVEAHCAKLGSQFRFFHLLPWPGYKSGALNFALAQSATDTEIIAVVDADYVVDSNFLADLVGHFSDESISFVQTPQDYRDQHSRGTYGRALWYAYMYFFAVSMVGRNESNSIIYAGTMGLIRKSALERVGGWNEWCITEDAELSLRLLAAGYRSLYVHKTYGRGLMPLDLAGLKKQRFRWAFGGMQILRMHFGKLLNPKSGLSFAQRFSYLNGGLQWLNDPLSLGYTMLLIVGSASLIVGQSFFSQPLTQNIILISPLFLLISITRFLWAFRVRTECKWTHAVEALTILLALTWVVAQACVRGLFCRKGVFLRTPKQGVEPSIADIFRVVRVETILGVVCLSCGAALISTGQGSLLSARSLTIALLFWQAATYIAAVQAGAWSHQQYQTTKPPRWLLSFRNVGYDIGSYVTEGRAAAVAVLLVFFLGGFLYLGYQRAPFSERTKLADPLKQFLPARSLLPTSPTALAGATLIQEADAAQRGDVASALRLWDRDGMIVDVSIPMARKQGENIWSGIDAIQARYMREFKERSYEALHHVNLQVEEQGDEITIVNDLEAVIRSGAKTQHLNLRGTDKWTLRRRGESWKIVRLEVNKAWSDPKSMAELRK